jgi:hypothetical protein
MSELIVEDQHIGPLEDKPAFFLNRCYDSFEIKRLLGCYSGSGMKETKKNECEAWHERLVRYVNVEAWRDVVSTIIAMLTSRQPPRLIRRGIVCLLLGWLAWWLVYWWIEPKPLWTVPAAGQNGTNSVFDVDDENQVTLVWEDPQYHNNENKHPVLQVYSLRDGKRLNTLSLGVEETSIASALFLFGEVWRKKVLNDQVQEIRCWRWKDAGPEKIVHTCKTPEEYDCTIYWPEHCQHLLIKQSIPWQILPSLLLTQQLGPFGAGVVSCFEPDYAHFTAYQLMELNSTGEPGCRVIRSWREFQPGNEDWRLSPNGRYLVKLRIHDRHPALLHTRLEPLWKERRTLAEHLKAIGGYRQHIELADALTGKTISSQAVETGSFLDLDGTEMQGDLLLVQCKKIKEQQTLSGTAFYRFLRNFDQSYDLDNQPLDYVVGHLLYQTTPTGLKSISLPKAGEDMSIVLQGHNNSVFLRSHLYDWIGHLTADRLWIDREEKVLGTRLSAGQHHEQHVEWRNEGGPIPNSLYEYSRERPWLYQWIEPFCRQEITAVLYDANLEPLWRWHRMEVQVYSGQKGNQYMFLTPYRWVNENRVNTELRCYRLPLVTYSLWWPRVAGLLTTILTWFAIRWSYSRRSILPRRG